MYFTCCLVCMHNSLECALQTCTPVVLLCAMYIMLAYIQHAQYFTHSLVSTCMHTTKFNRIVNVKNEDK